MFAEKITNRAHASNTRLCVGLDPILEKITAATGSNNVFDFNKQVIDATAEFALCYKPQIAHYSALSIENQLEDTIHYIHNTYPDIPVILDSKRGDIGSTAECYAREAFERYQADAVTVNPYLGADSIKPFVDYKDKGVIVLAKTSNPSAALLQDLDIDGKPLYVFLTEALLKQFPNLLFVVGATDKEALQTMHAHFPDQWFLVPGVGAQGGTAEDVIKNAGANVIINATRSIIYPNNAGDDYFKAVKNSAMTLHCAIQQSL